MARGKTNEKIKISERRARALELRKRGLSYRAIGEDTKTSQVQAYRDVQAELKTLAEMNQDSAAELRQLELERIDNALHGMMPFIDAGNPNHVNAMARLIAERAKLLGLYEPTKLSVDIDIIVRVVTALESAGMNPTTVFEDMIAKAHRAKANVER